MRDAKKADSGFGIRDSGFGIRDSGFGIRDSENSSYGQMATDGSRKNSENTIRKTYKADAR